ncbi:hypothetical protein [Micromonospora sp. CPCC 206061]|uniref:hypothetical protein n=1 Tax=Micromonospora sp. CPCC 206061 TaxID=3122410 RepID=UPI002FF1D76F
MSDNQAISRLIAAAARVHLRSLGLRQKGRSRLWFDDHGWWLVVVEFQPGRGPGTYLNVGAMWLWAERDYWAFDEGCRVYWRDDGSFTSAPRPGEQGWQQHVDFVSVEQFARDVAPVATVAAGCVAELRTQFPDPAAVAERMTTSPARPGNTPLWRMFHGGVAAALSGDAVTGDRCLAEVMSTEMFANWQHSLAVQAADLRSLLGEPLELHGYVLETIRRTRHMLKLPEVDFDGGGLRIRR